MEIVDNTNLVITLSDESEYVVRCGYCNAVIKFKDTECDIHQLPDFLYSTIHCPKCGKDSNADIPGRHLVLYRKNLTDKDLICAMRNPNIVVL